MTTQGADSLGAHLRKTNRHCVFVALDAPVVWVMG